MATYAMPLRVRYVECDMQGRAFSGHYLTWVDMAHTKALRQAVGGIHIMVDRGVDVVVAAAELQFRQPAGFDDELVVEVTLDPPGRTSLRSTYVIRRGNDVVAGAAMIHVCVEATTCEKREWPDWFRDQLAAAS